MCSVCSCFWPLPLIISCILLSSGITHTSRDCHCALHTAVFHVTFSLKWKLEFWALRHRSFTTHVATMYVLFPSQVQAVKKQKFCSENRSDGRTEQCLNFVFLLYLGLYDFLGAAAGSPYIVFKLTFSYGFMLRIYI